MPPHTDDRREHRHGEADQHPDDDRGGRAAEAGQDRIHFRRERVGGGVSGRDAEDHAGDHAKQPVGERDAGIDLEVVSTGRAQRLHHADLPLLLDHQRRDDVDHQEAGHNQGDQRQEAHQVADGLRLRDQRVLGRVLREGEGDGVGRVLRDEVLEVVELLLGGFKVSEARPEVVQAHAPSQ